MTITLQAKDAAGNNLTSGDLTPTTVNATIGEVPGTTALPTIRVQ